ncbi:sigma-70 family RNA polymerase sigma factor [Nonomuraea sp. PA05]|uniref:sigma-70 family RNA polymerase sigma factor n=1 Tax=Nonomuraea sp. PA05 TaxID=2604466 RepID=UPI0011D662A7|nr:sigma-70 family RNA polymerase sigma factor [Nonomuraea sp. PA05]TYB66768.1 sigma-70 family RNA polymerase sigma factor [Nonomuraea sp. PA05]
MSLLESYRDSATQVDDRTISGWDGAAATFVGAAPRLYAIGLRVLQDTGEAEDVVQETWLRWARANRSVVVSPAAFLALTTTRLAINVTQSARKRRETSAGPWLPDTPDQSAGPEVAAERHEAVDGAVRMLLERLTAAERGVYLLRMAFDYPYRQIGEVLGLSEEHTRQLLRRARHHLAEGRVRPVSGGAHRRLVRAFLAAARSGELGGLESLLAAEVNR